MIRRILSLCIVALFFSGITLSVKAAESPARVTIIYDAFGKPSGLARGWGYSALIEYGGKRILFDTGGQYQVFADNVRKLKINLKSLDFVVLSHRHGDHTSGLAYVLQQNPKVKVYAPLEGGSFGTPVLKSGGLAKLIERRVAEAPEHTHFYEGKYPDNYPVDAPWPKANITQIDKPLEVLPGFFLFRTVSENKGTLELNELSLAIKTPKGLAVIVGCSHPGIEKILAAATQFDPNVYSVFGGLHLVDSTDEQVVQVVSNFVQKWKIERIAAGHCSGEFAQAQFSKQFGEKHDISGLGAVIPLPR